MRRRLIYALLLLVVSACRSPDTNAPSVRFLAPQDNDTLYAGMILLKTAAYDNLEVTNVRFYQDTTYLDSTGLSYTDTFSIIWDATAETLDASYQLRAIAYDRWQNIGRDSVRVFFCRSIPPGSLTVTSVPSGAAIWLDGVNTAKVTPATIESIIAGNHTVKLTLAHYNDWDTTVQVYGGQATQLSATLYGYVVVTGTIIWPGHRLSPRCVALLDTSHDGHGTYILYSPADTATGTFTLTARLSLIDSAYVLGFDDVDGNRYPSSGDGRGFWDYNGDQQMTVADMIPLAPGDTIRNALIYLVTVP